MVLLDDSNSYWWLVRIVKDGSIGRLPEMLHEMSANYPVGYLPAEHIETPTERLARLNKHRNVDVSANVDPMVFSNVISCPQPCLAIIRKSPRIR